MRRYLYHPDAGSVVMSAGFTVASMGLSAYCGWNIADGSHFAMKAVSAILFSLVAFGLSIYVVRRERYKLSRNKEAYDGAKRIVYFLLIANLLTDYSASAALRDLTNVKSDNKNTIATNARNEVSRLNEKIAKLQTERAWLRTDLESPAAYDAKIFAQKQKTERGRNIWQRSKQCNDTTVATSQAVCTKIASLKATKAMAERRTELLPEIRNLETQLVAAKGSVKSNGKSANAALAPIRQLVSMLTLSLNNEESEIQWGQNFFVLFFTFVITAAIYFSSADLGRRMGPMPDREPVREPEPQVDNFWRPIEDQREPIPLKSEPAPTRVHTATTGSDPESWRESMEALDRILARVKAKKQASV